MDEILHGTSGDYYLSIVLMCQEIMGMVIFAEFDFLGWFLQEYERGHYADAKGLRT